MNKIYLNTIGTPCKAGGGGNSGGGNSGGGGNTPSAPSRGAVNFKDYDGTILHSYTKDAFLALAEMPALPTRQGLTCQGWNYNIEDAKAYVEEYGTLDIGATYITDDGKTRFYIKVEGERKEFPFNFNINKANSLVIDWGDGAKESISGSGSLNVSHTYDVVGDFVISLEVAEGAKLTFSGSSSGFVAVPYANMIQKVEIGNATSIGNYAFQGCYSLSSIVIPNNVTNIGDNAFQKCYSLSSIVIPNGVTSIGKLAFGGCYSLSSIVIPNSVTSIGNYPFSSCYSLSSIVIPNGVTSIGQQTFQDCHSLSSAVIPNGVTSIGERAFQKCYSLSSIVIPNSVTSIGGSAFDYCYSLSSAVISNGVTSIGTLVFQNCYSLSSAVIPNSVTSIGGSAFLGCYSLSSIVIPNGVTSIGSSAFQICYSLSSIVIPNSVTSIGGSAFQNCSSIAYFDFRNHTSIPNLSNYSAFTGVASDCKIVVPDVLYDEWVATTNWSSHASKVVKASEFNA